MSRFIDCVRSAVSGDYDLTSTPYYFEVLVGSTHKLGQSRLGTPYRIRADRVVLFPNLTRSADRGVDWDLALVRLSVPTTLTPYVQPACLPHQGQSTPPVSLCYVAGWGLMNSHQGRAVVIIISLNGGDNVGGAPQWGTAD